MAAQKIISGNWRSDLLNPGYCLSTPLLVDGKHFRQKVFLAHLNRTTVDNWKEHLDKVAGKQAAKAAPCVLYAEASYLRYSSAVFRQAAVSDWNELLATKIDSKDYVEQTFLLASISKEQCDVKEAIGLCLVRRSWANNLFLDYLAKSPQLFSDSRVVGVAEGLIYTVMLMGMELKCRYLYLEPSREAQRFYSKLFGAEIEDLEKIPIEPALTRVQSVLEMMEKAK